MWSLMGVITLISEGFFPPCIGRNSWCSAQPTKQYRTTNQRKCMLIGAELLYKLYLHLRTLHYIDKHTADQKACSVFYLHHNVGSGKGITWGHKTIISLRKYLFNLRGHKVMTAYFTISYGRYNISWRWQYNRAVWKDCRVCVCVCSLVGYEILMQWRVLVNSEIILKTTRL